MSNRKRVTLTFEIDDHDGFNDEAFMRRDFLQELACCVNNPYEGTFVMKIEDIDPPHEMTAREYEKALWRMHEKRPFCNELKQYMGIFDTRFDNPSAIEEAVAIVEKWAQEHKE